MTDYYVKSSGSDAATGLDDTNAWATIAYANSQLSDGDTLYINGGDTFQVTSPVFAPGDNVTYDAYGTGIPTIDGGADSVGGGWWGTYSGIFQASGKTNVHYKNIKALDSGGFGFRFYQSTGGSCVNCESYGAAFGGFNIRESSGQSILNSRAYWTCRYYGWGSHTNFNSAIQARDSSDIVIRGNSIGWTWGEGINCYWGSSNCLVEDNVLWACRTVYIYFDNSQFCTAQRNLCIGMASQTETHATRALTSGRGLEFNNEDHPHDQGWLPQSWHGKGHKMVNNLLCGTSVGLAIWGTSNAATYWEDILIAHNTFIDCTIGIRGFSYNTSTQCDASSVEIRNNIWQNYTGGLTLSNAGSFTDRATVTNNYYWTTAPSGGGTNAVTSGILLATTGGWRYPSDPATITSADFVQQATSTAIAAGVYDARVANDFAGDAYNDPPAMGGMAYEPTPPVSRYSNILAWDVTQASASALSSPAASRTGDTTFQAHVNAADNSGTLYWVQTQDATEPSNPQIEAGNDAGGTEIAAGSLSPSEGSNSTPDLTIADGEAHYVYWSQNHGGGSTNVATSQYSHIGMVLSSAGNAPAPLSADVWCESTSADGTTHIAAWKKRPFYSVANGDSQAEEDADKALIIAGTDPDFVHTDSFAASLNPSDAIASLLEVEGHYVGWVQTDELSALYFYTGLAGFTFARTGAPTKQIGPDADGLLIERDGADKEVHPWADYSGGTYSNGSGLSQGVLLEGERENEVTYSWNLQGVYVDGVTLAEDLAGAPDATSTLNTITDVDADSGAHYCRHSSTGFNYTTGATITLSIFIKKGTAQYVQPSLHSGGDAGFINVDTTDWTITHEQADGAWALVSSDIEVFTTDIARVQWTITATGDAGGFLSFAIVPASNSSWIASYAADGTGTASFWGWEAEEATFASSHKITDGGKIIRPATSMTANLVDVNSAAFTNDFSGTLKTRINVASTVTTGDLLLLTFGDTTNGLQLKVNQSAWTLTKYVSGTPYSATATQAYSLGDSHTVVFSIDSMAGVDLDVDGQTGSNANATDLAAAATTVILEPGFQIVEMLDI